MIVGVNKCNIIEYSLSKVNELLWGMKATVNVDKAILENYLQYLDCPTVELATINPDICSNPTINFRCQLSSGAIIVNISSNTGILIFSIDETQIINGKSPFTYTWSYDPDDIILTSGINSNSVSFKLKDGKNIDNIVVAIGVDIVDSNGCKYSKSCYLVNKAMECIVNYAACRTVNSLVVTNVVTAAVPPSGLIVTLI